MNDEAPAWQGKCDHRLRALWARAAEPDRAQQSVRVLLRFTGSIDPITKGGAQIHAVAGDIASGTIVLEALPRVANLSGVVFIELAQVLGQDQ